MIVLGDHRTTNPLAALRRASETLTPRLLPFKRGRVRLGPGGRGARLRAPRALTLPVWQRRAKPGRVFHDRAPCVRSVYSRARERERGEAWVPRRRQSRIRDLERSGSP